MNDYLANVKEQRLVLLIIPIADATLCCLLIWMTETKELLSYNMNSLFLFHTSCST